MFLRRSITSIIVVIASYSISLAVEFEPGEWQTEVRIEFNGAMFPVPFTTKKCLTQEDPIPNTTANNANCSISDVSESQQEIAWTLHCDDKKGSLHGVGSIIFEDTAFTGTMDMEIRDDEGELENQHRYHMTGIRKGPCKPN